jgi:hypothetical protein
LVIPLIEKNKWRVSGKDELETEAVNEILAGIFNNLLSYSM